MSIDALAWAFKVQGISPNAKFVLIALSDAHNGHTGECFPRIKRLTQTTLFSESTVHRATAELEKAGLIRKEIIPDEDGRTRGIRYHLACDRVSNRQGGVSNGQGEGVTQTGGRVSNRQPSKDNQKEETRKNNTPRPPEGFEEWYREYPRREARGAAEKAYAAARKIASQEELVVGARRYARSRVDPKYQKHPATWLNGRCWLDEAPAMNGVSARDAQIAKGFI